MNGELSIVNATFTIHDSRLTIHDSRHFIDRAPAAFRPAEAALAVRVQRHLVVDRNLLAGKDVAQGVELDAPVEDFHVAVGLTRMVDVVRAVAAATAV